jgi:plasmid stabilization system protein ParE
VRVEFHPAVEQDVAEALRRYDSVSARLGQEFQVELRRVIAVAAAKPGRFHLIKPGLHRANLKRFPYHFVYRELPDGIRVILVRHHRRDPRFGLEWV